MDDEKYLDEEDRALWRQAMGIDEDEEDVQEEDFASMLDGHEAPEKKDVSEKVVESSNAKMKKRGHAGFELDRRTDEKLRKGQISIEARCDLHGLTQQEAKAQLDRFLQDSVSRGRRCVLVITGKGKSRVATDAVIEPEKGVLKQRLPEWLSQAPWRKNVLKYYPARPKDGGSGAFYIYLRRTR